MLASNQALSDLFEVVREANKDTGEFFGMGKVADIRVVCELVKIGGGPSQLLPSQLIDRGDRSNISFSKKTTASEV
jgi:hypothetical protein